MMRVARIALLAMYVALIAAEVSAQNIDTLLMPGMTAWITDATGREEKTRVVDVSRGIVTTTSSGANRYLRAADIIRVRARRRDPVLNGALIGAGVALGSGLFLCRLTESWEICRGNVGPIVTISAVGAGIGVAVDALIRGRVTIYESAGRSLQLQAVPVVAVHAAGVQVTLDF
jgi:hypothetical protein